jgi:hypothetical protein
MPMFHVEHSFYEAYVRILLILIIPAIFFGCKSRDENPHLKDRIYQSIVKKQGEAKAFFESEKKKAEEWEKQIEKSLPQTGQAVQFQRQLNDMRARMQKADQMYVYYTLLKSSREKDVKKRYLASLEKNEEFSTDSEYQSYETSDRLYRSSRNWGDRVPRPASKAVAPVKKEDSSAKDSGGGP